MWFVFLKDCFDYFEEKEQQRMGVEPGGSKLGNNQ